MGGKKRCSTAYVTKILRLWMMGVKYVNNVVKFIIRSVTGLLKVIVRFAGGTFVSCGDMCIVSGIMYDICDVR